MSNASGTSTITIGKDTFEITLTKVSKNNNNNDNNNSLSGYESPRSEGGGKKSKKENATRKMNGGKRKLTGYMKFAQEVRPRIMKESPGMKIPDIGRAIGAQWRALSDSEKAKY